MSRRRLFTSESVSEGHPDKMADQISDSILDAILAEDPDGRVACETLVTTGMAVVAGEISTSTYVDIPRVVRDTILSIGYDSSDLGFDGNTCGVAVALDEQSSDIAMGVDEALEHRGQTTEDRYATLGAGDQGMMFGFACRETESMMPLTIDLAHRMARKIADVRHKGDLAWLRPDAKTQVTAWYEGDQPVGIDTVVVSTQHDDDVTLDEVRAGVTEHVVHPLLPEGTDPEDVRIIVNPTGRFVSGGPVADAGLTGRKIIVDTYGGVARHGGGAFSGKDPSKVDRSAAYATRWVAKNVVAAGLADRCELQVAYAIGKAEPVSLMVETFGTETEDPSRIEEAIRQVFDLRPAAIIDALDLKSPGYRETAAYGHFGREGDRFTWERTDRTDALRDAL